MLIIQDASGEIIAAQVVAPVDSEIATFITPVSAEHTLSEIRDVPAEILDLDHPDQFEKAISDYVRAGHAQVRQTNLEELQEELLRQGFGERREATGQ